MVDSRWLIIHRLVFGVGSVDKVWLGGSIIDVSLYKGGMQNNSRMLLKEGTEEVREGYKIQAQVEDVPKGDVQKGNRRSV